MRQTPVQLGKRVLQRSCVFGASKRGPRGLLADRPGKHAIEPPDQLVAAGEAVA